MVLLGDFLAPLPEIQAVVARLAGIPVTGTLLQVLDPAEALLPYSGRIRFRGLEREGETLIPRVEGVREAYAAKLLAQQDGLRAAVSVRRGSASPSIAPTIRRKPRCSACTPRWRHDDARYREIPPARPPLPQGERGAATTPAMPVAGAGWGEGVGTFVELRTTRPRDIPPVLTT